MGGGGLCWRGRLPLVNGVWRRRSVHHLWHVVQRVGGGLGFDLKLASSPRFSSYASRFEGFLRTSCSAGWRSNGDASSGSGETLDRRVGHDDVDAAGADPLHGGFVEVLSTHQFPCFRMKILVPCFGRRWHSMSLPFLKASLGDCEEACCCM